MKQRTHTALALALAVLVPSCIRLRNPNAGSDGSTADTSARDVTGSDIARVDAIDDMTVIQDDVSAPDASDDSATIDTGVIVDTGVTVDSGVIVDTGVIIDTGVRCPDWCAPTAALRNCGGACMTDINEDPTNCGACGVRCGAQEHCLQGMCSAHEWVTTSEFATCAAISGRAYCWGRNLSQSVAAGASNVSTPTLITMAATMDRTFMIAHGNEATTAIAATATEPMDLGSAFFWGTMNAIDGSSAASSATPARLPMLFEQLVEVKAAHSIAQFCGRTATRQVYCWGRDDAGALARTPGIPNGSVARMPQRVLALDGAVELSMGDRFGCARMCGGRVLCWGSNEDHQLGRSTGANEFDENPAPVLLSMGVELSDAISIAAGFNHACAVRANGTVVCWGANQCGQLGDGTEVTADCNYNASGAAAVDTMVPTVVRAIGGMGTLTGALSVTAGQSTSCAIVRSGTAGTLYCWGASHFGQIRTPPDIPNWIASPLDIRLGAGESVVQASAGYGHTCARMASGAVRCWGRNTFGELGGSVGDAGAVPFSSTRDR